MFEVLSYEIEVPFFGILVTLKVGDFSVSIK